MTKTNAVPAPVKPSDIEHQKALTALLTEAAKAAHSVGGPKTPKDAKLSKATTAKS